MIEGTLIFNQKALDDKNAKWCVMDPSGNVVSRDDIRLDPAPKSIIYGDRNSFPVDSDMVHVSIDGLADDCLHFRVRLQLSDMPFVGQNYIVKAGAIRMIS